MQKIILVCLMGTVLMLGSVVGAEEADGMETTFAAGLALTDGNSETMQANASLVTVGEKDGLGSVRAGVEGNYGETTVAGKDQTNVENARAFANAKKTLTEMTFASLDGTVLYDDIALVDYRATIGPALGVYLIKDDATKLSVEAGVSYVWEEVAKIDDDYVALRAAERFDHAFSETAKIWQSAEYLPQANDTDNYLLNAELGVEAAMNASLNLRIVLQDKYDSQPALGLDRNDISLIAGVSVNL